MTDFKLEPFDFSNIKKYEISTILVVGWSGSGKTQLINSIVKWLDMTTVIINTVEDLENFYNKDQQEFVATCLIFDDSPQLFKDSIGLRALLSARHQGIVIIASCQSIRDIPRNARLNFQLQIARVPQDRSYWKSMWELYWSGWFSKFAEFESFCCQLNPNVFLCAIRGMEKKLLFWTNPVSVNDNNPYSVLQQNSKSQFNDSTTPDSKQIFKDISVCMKQMSVLFEKLSN